MNKTKRKPSLPECINFINSLDLSSKSVMHQVYESETEYFYHALLILNKMPPSYSGASKEIIERLDCKTLLEFYKKFTLEGFKRNATILTKRESPEDYSEFMQDVSSMFDIYINHYLKGVFRCYGAITKNKEMPFILDISDVINLNL